MKAANLVSWCNQRRQATQTVNIVYIINVSFSSCALQKVWSGRSAASAELLRTIRLPRGFKRRSCANTSLLCACFSNSERIPNVSSVRRPSKKAGFIYSQLMDLDHRTNRRKKKKQTHTFVILTILRVLEWLPVWRLTQPRGSGRMHQEDKPFEGHPSSRNRNNLSAPQSRCMTSHVTGRKCRSELWQTHGKGLRRTCDEHGGSMVDPEQFQPTRAGLHEADDLCHSETCTSTR